MPRVATIVPDETDLLCESCGYTLNGLPETGNCPECGQPIEDSLGTDRNLSEFERHPGAATFIRTTMDVVLSPRRFYRHLSTRQHTPAGRAFASMHLGLATILFGLAMFGHLTWMAGRGRRDATFLLACLLLAGPAIYAVLVGLTRLASWLSAIEARYWGMRLPYAVVSRALAFHSAHYLPVGLIAVTIVWGYVGLLERRVLDRTWDLTYLYTLCGAVIVSAIYLFRAYWIAMKCMMYANR